MFRTVFLSITRSSRQYILQQAYVKQILRHCFLASRQQYLFDKCLLQYVQSLTPDDGRKDSPKHVERNFKIKCFDTLMHLVGFSIEIYYDARPHKHQNSHKQTLKKIVACFLTEVLLNIWIYFYVLHNPLSSLRTWQGRKFDAELRFIRSPYQTYLAFNGGTNTRPANTEWSLMFVNTLVGQRFKHIWHTEHKVTLQILILSRSVKDETTCQPESPTFL